MLQRQKQLWCGLVQTENWRPELPDCLLIGPSSLALLVRATMDQRPITRYKASGAYTGMEMIIWCVDLALRTSKVSAVSGVILGLRRT